MPHVQITLGGGRSEEQLRAMIHRVHAALVETVDARPDHVRIVVHEVPRTRWATGDVTLRERDEATGPPTPTPDPEQEEQS